MGYTRYWERTAKPIDEEFVEFCNEVFKTCTKLGIKLGNSCGIDTPTANTRLIAFNGDASKDLNHESCILDDKIGFNFCKTARKPYDYAVRTILREALTRGYITDLSDDGINEEIISDIEYFER
jgi:hypothetical protein